MQLLGGLILVVAAFSCVSARRVSEESDLILATLAARMYEAKFNESIEGLKEKLKTGDEELGLPSCDPLEIAHLPLNISNDFLVSNLVLDNLRVDGIPDFVVSELKFAILGFKLTFKVILPQLVIDTDYDGNLTLFDFIPIYGKGHIAAEINGIEVSGSLNVNTPGGFIVLANTNLTLGLESATFKITGLLNDEEASQLVSEMLTEVVPSFIHDRQEWITEKLSPIVESVANEKIDGLTLDDILGGL